MNGPAGWKRIDGPGFITDIGPLWIRREGELRAFGLQTNDRHVNPQGFVHGGVIAALADHALSILAWEGAGRAPCSTVQLDMHFLSACSPGDFLEARGAITRKGRELVFLQGTISVSTKSIATASGVWKILLPR